MGFANSIFANSVIDWFPKSNYDGLPMPIEELQMFCYSTGYQLKHGTFKMFPKNEQGDIIYVLCDSFMEPLTSSKKKQLNVMSEWGRINSLLHQ